MDNKNTLNSILISLVISVFIVTIIGSISLAWLKDNPEFVARLVEKAAEKKNADLHPSEAVVVDVVNKANSAVVAITISKNIPVYERYFERIPLGNNLFSFTVPRLRQNGTEKIEVGGGSGFLVSGDGYIVTNKHVVSDTAAEYTVFTNDGNKYNASVIYRDPGLDLAIIKIDGTEFAYLPFGDSDKLKVGQSVISIGNALAEFRNTVSLGIVSGLSRSVVASDRSGRNAEELDELIQTDAAINEGNSGGPLLSLSGEVIGVNIAIVSGAENIGFALSSNSVKSIVDRETKS